MNKKATYLFITFHIYHFFTLPLWITILQGLLPLFVLFATNFYIVCIQVSQKIAMKKGFIHIFLLRTFKSLPDCKNLDLKIQIIFHNFIHQIDTYFHVTMLMLLFIYANILNNSLVEVQLLSHVLNRIVSD